MADIQDKMPIRRALLSVADKRGLADFGRGLQALGVELLSTGGTAKALRQAGLEVTDVAQVTGYPEMLSGRVKTLHPAIHAAILARRTAADLAELTAQNIRPIDLVVVNLYPFQATVARPDTTLSEAVEEIDIGGVALLRAAAKNFAYVTVVINPDDYPRILQELQATGGISLATRRALAYAAFNHTATYDAAIAAYLFSQGFAGQELFPPTLHLSLSKIGDLRYGENPHQRAALYRLPGTTGVAWGRLLQGKELSFNNFLDLDAAWRAVNDFSQPAAVIVKHTTPCGAACAQDLATAYELAYQGDPLSAFGGILGCNRPVDRETALAIGNRFLECIVAPGFTPESLEILAKKKDCRLLEMGPCNNTAGYASSLRPEWDCRFIGGGFLLQEADAPDEATWRLVSKRQPTPEEMMALRFAWRLVRHVKSNAIVLAKGQAMVGFGGGQTSRVEAVDMALRKAGERARGAVLASDAFFPFRDGVDIAAAGGVTAVVQPGGSVRDAEVIAAADEHGLSMLFTGVRHFRH